MQNAIN